VYAVSNTLALKIWMESLTGHGVMGVLS